MAYCKIKLHVNIILILNAYEDGALESPELTVMFSFVGLDEERSLQNKVGSTRRKQLVNYLYSIYMQSNKIHNVWS